MLSFTLDALWGSYTASEIHCTGQNKKDIHFRKVSSCELGEGLKMKKGEGSFETIQEIPKTCRN